MTMTRKSLNRFGLVLTLIGLLILGLGMYSFVTSKNSSNAAPAPSSATQNLEVLKSAQPNDLLLCVIPGDGPLAPLVKRAIIINQNDGEYLTGHELDYHTSNLNSRYSYDKFSDCEVRLERDMPTSSMPAHIGRIFLYGLNPKPPVN